MKRPRSDHSDHSSTMTQQQYQLRLCFLKKIESAPQSFLVCVVRRKAAPLAPRTRRFVSVPYIQYQNYIANLPHVILFFCGVTKSRLSHRGHAGPPPCLMSRRFKKAPPPYYSPFSYTSVGYRHRRLLSAATTARTDSIILSHYSQYIF